MRGVKQKNSFAARAFWMLTGVALMITAAHLVFQYLNLVVFYQQVGQFYELSNRFDFDDESSVPTWFSQGLFLAVFIAASLAAYLQPDKFIRRFWILTAALGLVFSLDEIAGLHERILQSLHVVSFEDATPTGLANAWWIVLPFILLAGGWLVWKMYSVLPRRTILLFILSGVVFLSGAVGADLIASVEPRENFLNQGVFVAIEETLELLGTVIALYAILNYIETHHPRQIKSAIKQLKAGR